MIIGVCKTCGGETLSYPGRLRSFCSRSCRSRGAANGKYKGEEHTFICNKPSTYTGIPISRKYVKDATERKWIPEHRAIAEKAVGRRLKKIEVVHHINCDPTDNRNENLLVCSKAYHTWLHQRMGQLWAESFFTKAKEVVNLPSEVIEDIGVC